MEDHPAFCSVGFFFVTQDHLPRGSTTQVGWALQRQALTKKMPPIDLPTGQYDRHFIN